MLVQPRLLAKTELITRQLTIVASESGERVEVREKSEEGVEAPIPGRAAVPSGKQHLKDWWQPVLDMKFNDPEQDPPYWVGTNNIVLRTPFPGIVIKAFARVGSPAMEVFVSGTRTENVRAIEEFVREERRALIRELPPGTEICPENDWPVITHEQEIEDDDERRAWIIKTLNTYVTVLRPRLRKWFAAAGA
jgi:hypothetical protein